MPEITSVHRVTETTRTSWRSNLLREGPRLLEIEEFCKQAREDGFTDADHVAVKVEQSGSIEMHGKYYVFEMLRSNRLEVDNPKSESEI